MDLRSRSIVFAYYLVAIVVAFVIGFFVQKAISKPKYLALTEYWIYSPQPNLPNETELFERLVGSNPYIRKGQNPIGPAEGLIFSDVRFKMSLVKRESNPKLFDLSEMGYDDVEMDSEIMLSKSIVRLQYISETPLNDKRHLQFLLHLADAVATLTQSRFIRDCVAAKFWEKAELEKVLAENFDVTGNDFHLKVSETEDDTFETSGYRKIGLNDIETLPISHDQMSLARELLGKYFQDSWRNQSFSEVPIEAYGDEFFMVQKPVRKGKTPMKIVRKQVTL